MADEMENNELAPGSKAGPPLKRPSVTTPSGAKETKKEPENELASGSEAGPPLKKKARLHFIREPFNGQKEVNKILEKLGSSLVYPEAAFMEMKKGRKSHITAWCISREKKHPTTVQVGKLLTSEKITCAEYGCPNKNKTIPFNQQYNRIKQQLLEEVKVELLDSQEQYIAGTTARIKKKKGKKKGVKLEGAGQNYKPLVRCVLPGCKCGREIVRTTTLGSLLSSKSVGCSGKSKVPYSDRWNEVIEMESSKKIKLKIKTEEDWKSLFSNNKNKRHGEIEIYLSCQKTDQCKTQWIVVLVTNLFNRDNYWCRCSKRGVPYDSEAGYNCLVAHSKLIKCAPINTVVVYLQNIRNFKLETELDACRYTPKMKCLDPDCPDPYFNSTTVNSIQQGRTGCGCNRSQYERRVKLILDELLLADGRTSHPPWLTYNIGKCSDCGAFHNSPLELDLDYPAYNFYCEVNGHPGHDGKVWHADEGMARCTVKKDQFKVDKCAEHGKIFLVLSSEYGNLSPARLKPIVVAKVRELIPDLDEQVSRGIDSTPSYSGSLHVLPLKKITYADFIENIYIGNVTKIDIWENRYIQAFDKEPTLLQSFSNNDELRITNKIRTRATQRLNLPRNYREYLDYGFFLWDTKNLAKHVSRRFGIEFKDLLLNPPGKILEHLESLRQYLKQTGSWKNFGGEKGRDLSRPSYFVKRYQNDLLKIVARATSDAANVM